MKFAALFSGGKDSTFAIFKAIKEGHTPACLISIRSQNPASYMFHTANIDLTSLQAQCLGLPLIIHPTKGVKEAELADLKDAIKKAKDQFKIEAVVSGAVGSQYQKERVEAICADLNLKSIAPLWHRPQQELVEEMIGAGFVFKIVAVAGMGLGKELLGKDYDKDLLKKLISAHERFGVHIAGEGGEFESLVTDCPLFKKRLMIDKAQAEMAGEWEGLWRVEKAHIEDKSPSK